MYKNRFSCVKSEIKYRVKISAASRGAIYMFFQLELSELALNLIFAMHTGNWELYLPCVQEVCYGINTDAMMRKSNFT